MSKENEFEIQLNQITSVPSRSPLNSIPDPSQYQSKTPEHDTKEKSQSSTRLISPFLKTPGSRIHAQTSSRSGSRSSNGGATSRGFSSAALVRFPGGARFGVLPRVSRGISVAIPQDLSVEVPYFELDQDLSFWKDHNLQVLIRIRPLNDVEMVPQGYGRCLRQETAQTVVWLGPPETRFTFDHIACESTSQEKLFRVAGLPMVDNCMSGYNSCMFAYGQTGSGKTYTMMGEVDKMDGKLSDDCGITPRIFKYLFTRIREEEESRKNERLTYSCKCSFLEIYNEHITDLLEPSSTNLQLREDVKKGVYVENLTEHSVGTVNDMLKLLQQGAANRKIAATYMNSESSRSHSVFTCTIESCWEMDSMAHLRFGRLNLVDLAGSERQKSSGAEGDRLKEAANINKSLSTLGLVIRSLVDLAQGKHCHVPYRDSRLTFLLQDSLGGNSKTTIIANVSPSARSANETLSTLKFAQSAKLIQNNAKINEDASGDVIALQQQIQQLKGQLSSLMKNPHAATELIDFAPSHNQSTSLSNSPRRYVSSDELHMYDEHETPTEEILKTKYFKDALLREKLAETEVRRLKTDIERLNRLAHQREEEMQHAKMMLKFREEKIKRLELLSDGLISDDKLYLDDNNALREENIRLLEQIRSYQDRERESQAMLVEMPELRNQLLELLEVDKGHAQHQFYQWKGNQELKGSKEFQHCKDMNSKLVREIEELCHQLENGMNCDQDTSILAVNALLRSRDEIICDKNDKQNVMNFKAEQMEDILDLQIDNIHKELMDAQSLIATMKLEQFNLIKELESAQAENQYLIKMLGSKKISQSKMDNNREDYDQKLADCRNQDQTANIEVNENTSISSLQAKMDKLFCDLKEAEILNRQYTEDHTRQISQDHQLELVRDEIELETTKTIIHLQEEIDRLQSEFQVRLCSLAEQNVSLRKNLEVKEDELSAFRAEWERAILELTTFLIDGSRSLGNASYQIKNISSSFANVHDWVSEHVEKAAKICVEKEETILLLQKSLEDAQKTVMEMEQKLYSLKDATIALTECQQLDNTTHAEEIQLSRTNDSVDVDDVPANKLISEKVQVTENQDNVVSNYSTSTLGGVERNVLLPQTNILSLLEKDFLQMHTSVEELLDIAHKDVEGKQASFSSLKFFLEDLMFKAIQNDISLFVLQCQMGEYFHELRILSMLPNSERYVVQEHCLIANGLELGHEGRNDDSAFHGVKCESGDYIGYMSKINTKELDLVHDETVNKSSELKKQLKRKDIILKGLFFDFSSLQELVSHRKDIKDELDKLILAMSKVQHELQIRTVQLDDVLVQNTKLEAHLAEAKQALFNSNSELDHAKGELSILSEQNVELKDILKDLYMKNSAAEQLLEEKKETIKSLEIEVIRVSSSAEKQLSSVEDIEDALTLATAERDELVEKVTCLQDELDMACALADENQSIAAEARQELEASKIFAEQKEEEVKILEHSIEELECTINVLENKVDEMEYEVEKNRVMRDSLELELQELRHRLLNVEDFTESMTFENSNTSLPDDQLSRKLHSKCVEINEAYSRIRFLEDENAKQSKEIKLFKDYISELVLHAEAQASQYQQQYKNLEQMLHEVKTDISNVGTASILERAERTSTKARGSSSPFKCIAGLVQQMNYEKDQELSLAKSHMEELEALAANKHKEVCILQTRLASTESMTHDVIRDLLSVKLDISNYVNIIDQHQLQKLIEDAQHKREEFIAMEQEIARLRDYIDDLLDERERCLSEINEIKENQLATQIILEQLQERDQLLTAKNDMLKMDKSNLQKRIMELDEMVKNLFKMRNIRPNNQSQTSSSLRPFESDLDERLVHSQKMLSRINNQLAQYRQPDGGKLHIHHETKLRKH